MQKLTLIVHASKQRDLADRLHTLPEVSGFSFSHIEGHGAHAHEHIELSAHDKVVGYAPYVRVELVLPEAQIEVVLAALRAESGIAAQGVYWVSPLTDYGRL